MSTIFSVYPGKEYIPSFAELLDISDKRINTFLADLSGFKSIVLDVEIHKEIDHLPVSFNISDKLIWNDDSYAWFFIHGVYGGTDSYFDKIEELDKEIWKEEIKSNIKAHQLQDIINRSINIGYYWSFRRSAGQPGIINLAYGLIAASLAELTDGFVFSDDGAWDYNCFPALADDFIAWYFKPEFTQNDEYKEWAQKCIELMYDELK